jgi:hypothetical protein
VRSPFRATLDLRTELPMNIRHISCLLALVIFSAQLAFAQQAHEDHPVESAHVAGPHGLEGWTLDSPLPGENNSDRYPFTLVIARNGKVVRKIQGSAAFVWRWIFWDDGRQVAYETGPLHFGMSCELYDLQTGKVLESVDCWQGIPDNSPAWLVALEKSR